MVLSLGLVRIESWSMMVGRIMGILSIYIDFWETKEKCDNSLDNSSKSVNLLRMEVVNAEDGHRGMDYSGRLKVSYPFPETAEMGDA